MTRSRSDSARKHRGQWFLASIAALFIAAGTSFWWGPFLGASLAQKYLVHARQFRVGQVYVTGNQQLSVSMILELAKVSKGTPLYEVSTTAIKKRLENYAWIRCAVARRHLPDAIEIKVWERAAVAAIQGESLMAVTEDGTVARPLPNTFANTLPLLIPPRPITVREGAVIRDESTLAMLSEARKVKSLSRETWSSLSKIYYTGHQMRATMTQPAVDVLIGRDVSETDWAGAMQILKQSQLNGITAYKRLDLRVPGKVIIGYESISGEESING